MNIWESIRMALESVRTNKLRSTLTMLGIVIGIAAVITVVAIGQGGRSLLMTEIQRFGTNIFAVYVDFQSDNPVNKKDFSLEDIDVIKTLVPAIRGISPSDAMPSTVRSANKGKFAQIQGCNGDYAQIHSVQMVQGRFFTNTETRSGRKVIVIDEKLAKDIFGKQKVLGQTVAINNGQLTVIGVSRSNSSILNGNFSTAYLPFKAWQQVFNVDVIKTFEGQPYPGEDLNIAMRQAVKILERKHNNPGRYMSVTAEQQMQIVSKITGVLTLVVGAIAGISLLVGGIGVMNIMLVSVTERTREIGIRKALGATRQDILLQFLVEALVLCSIGGVIGMLLGTGGAFLIAYFAKWPPLVSWTTMVVAFIFSSIVGIFFGIYPASKAAKLEPIEALRYE